MKTGFKHNLITRILQNNIHFVSALLLWQSYESKNVNRLSSSKSFQDSFCQVTNCMIFCALMIVKITFCFAGKSVIQSVT